MPNPLNPHDRAVNKVLRTINECNNLYLNPCNSAYRSGEFLPRLWCILNEPGLTHVISWADDGMSFLLSNKHAFEKHVLPHIYKATKVASFYRQLRLYGFKRLGSLQDEATTFEHRAFTRYTTVSNLYNVERLDFLSRNKKQGELDSNHPGKSSDMENKAEAITNTNTFAPPHLSYISATDATIFMSRVNIRGYAVPCQPLILSTPISTLQTMVHAPIPRGVSAQMPILRDDYEPEQDSHSNSI
ncbi:Heat shock factor protein 4 [Wallemia ichthyophaga EXF-994]|uniref:Heat shock factor protein 4 n=1 Tax=Wallemia ichthyophaga (strain EXF-994 / CBS 113033) TaxID=1299270 RepID=R9ARP4_WALI9|nr:Heat shock factor protein 4 [Wallemia ichthyophaga EXF-994]EOR04897.1 Heat shock factor protein 4 [Wallemia ichthyophaga EXF-994]